MEINIFENNPREFSYTVLYLENSDDILNPSYGP